MKILGAELRDYVAYGIVGVSATLVDYLCYIGITRSHPWFREQYLVANALGFCIAVWWGYYWHRRVTFRAQHGDHKKQFPRFVVVALVGLAVNSVALWVTIDSLHIYDILAKLLAIGVTAMWNFNAQRFWTFRKAPPPADSLLPDMPA